MKEGSHSSWLSNSGLRSSWDCSVWKGQGICTKYVKFRSLVCHSFSVVSIFQIPMSNKPSRYDFMWKCCVFRISIRCHHKPHVSLCLGCRIEVARDMMSSLVDVQFASYSGSKMACSTWVWWCPSLTLWHMSRSHTSWALSDMSWSYTIRALWMLPRNLFFNYVITLSLWADGKSPWSNLGRKRSNWRPSHTQMVLNHDSFDDQ